MTRRVCPDCGQPFTVELHRQTRCLAHQSRGRASRSPTTQAQNAEYHRHRQALLATNPPCWICGQPGADTADHVIPVAHGGTHHPNNLQPAHHACNSRRGATIRQHREGEDPPTTRTSRCAPAPLARAELASTWGSSPTSDAPA